MGRNTITSAGALAILSSCDENRDSAIEFLDFKVSKLLGDLFIRGHIYLKKNVTPKYKSIQNKSTFYLYSNIKIEACNVM